jgi:ATP-dependent HslUV protease ATP-binding subunit HslU
MVKDPDRELTPARIVEALDRHVVGQAAAKRAVAVAIRNRWRRLQLGDDLREEVTPRNILLIGPTGIGKTEIARRIATLIGAPFTKVEASKYTEVGYVGRDVESIVRDLVEGAIAMVREKARHEVIARARSAAEERVLDALLAEVRSGDPDLDPLGLRRDDTRAVPMTDMKAERVRLRELLRAGALDKREVAVQVKENAGQALGSIFPQEMMSQMGIDSDAFLKLLNRQRPPQLETRRVTVREAMTVLTEEESEGLVDKENVGEEAVRLVENSGIVFLDEIDKIAMGEAKGSGPDVSRQGVQRDLLPLVEGTTVSTRHGMVKTDHILFMAAGAFHVSKPSDLLPELQGRFPIRVRMDSLDEADFVRILVEPKGALTKQYTALLGAEGVRLAFTEDGIAEVARVAARANNQHENIGARRLGTVLERVLEDISFDAPARKGDHVRVDRAYVYERMGDLLEDRDLGRYVL